MTAADKQRHFISAMPGFWMLGLCGGLAEGNYEATRVPIVAWEMRLIDDDKPERGYFAAPVTPEWECDGIQHAPVLGPDGRVRVAGETTWDSEEDWLEDMKKKERKAQAGRKA